MPHFRSIVDVIDVLDDRELTQAPTFEFGSVGSNNNPPLRCDACGGAGGPMKLVEEILRGDPGSGVAFGRGGRGHVRPSRMPPTPPPDSHREIRRRTTPHQSRQSHIRPWWSVKKVRRVGTIRPMAYLVGGVYKMRNNHCGQYEEVPAGQKRVVWR